MKYCRDYYFPISKYQSQHSIEILLTHKFQLILANSHYLLLHEIILLIQGSFMLPQTKSISLMPLTCLIIYPQAYVITSLGSSAKICIQGSLDLNLRLYTSASCIVSTQCMRTTMNMIPQILSGYREEFSFQTDQHLRYCLTCRRHSCK